MTFYFTEGFERSFGTWPLSGDTLRSSVLSAIEVGYRSFDTAQMYRNEAELGSALKEAGLNRESICITTKVMASNYVADRFLPSVEASLRNLQTEYVDVLLLHWPDQFGRNSDALDGLQSAVERGYAHNIGVSNYTASMMEDAMMRLDATPVANQVEFHPLVDTTRLMAAAGGLGIPLAAYCPLARGLVTKDPVLQDVGERYSRSASQVTLRWILQKGVSINTMSTNSRHQADNFDILDFSLSSPDLAVIDGCMEQNMRIVDRNLVPTAPEWD